MNYLIGAVQNVICYTKINCLNILVFVKNKRSLKPIRIRSLIRVLKCVVRKEVNFVLILAR